MSIIHAKFENGVFTPTSPVELPEHCEVEFEPRIVPVELVDLEALDRVYAVLAERYDSGDDHVPLDHNEHQP